MSVPHKENNRTRPIVRRLVPVFIAFGSLAAVWVFTPERVPVAVGTIGASAREMLMILPPVFVLLGLFDVWVPRDRVLRLIGNRSGVRGTLVAIALGSLAAGPLYIAFPVAATLYRKGSSLFNIFVFVGAWSATKLPPLLVEIATLGPAFALIRLAVKVPAILFIAWVLAGLADSTVVTDLHARIKQAEGRS